MSAMVCNFYASLMKNSRREKEMIPRIKTIKPVEDYKLYVVFDDGEGSYECID